MIWWVGKLCDASHCKPLELIFKSCLENGKFSFECKKANVVSALEKGDKQTLKNDGSTYLLPVAGKNLKELFILICLNFLQKII